MRRWRFATCCFAVAFPLMAQEEKPRAPQQEPVLRNEGGPVHVPFACTSDNLDPVGLACSDDDPCPIYLELNSVASSGKRLFVAGDLHAQSATLDSILLASDDDGATWKEPAARVRGASLDQIQFYDAEHGWIGGETVYPLPRDPFLLITSDGGVSWRNRAITDEGGPGSVQRFLFDSPQHGQLLIDAGASAEGGRYREYETDTAGDAWSLRAASDTPPKMPAPPQRQPTLRLSAGKDAYRIEKKSDTLWLPVASFAVAAVTCKSPVSPSPAGEAPAPGASAQPGAEPKDQR